MYHVVHPLATTPLVWGLLEGRHSKYFGHCRLLWNSPKFHINFGASVITIMMMIKSNRRTTTKSLSLSLSQIPNVATLLHYLELSVCCCNRMAEPADRQPETEVKSNISIYNLRNLRADGICTDGFHRQTFFKNHDHYFMVENEMINICSGVCGLR